MISLSFIQIPGARPTTEHGIFICLCYVLTYFDFIEVLRRHRLCWYLFIGGQFTTMRPCYTTYDMDANNNWVYTRIRV